MFKAKFLLTIALVASLFLRSANPASAQGFLEELQSPTQNLGKYLAGPAKSSTCPDSGSPSGEEESGGFVKYLSAGIAVAITGVTDKCGNVLADGLLPQSADFISLAFENQPSSREYLADLVGNMGLVSVQPARAQGVGYSAMQSFLPFWKVFRNVAYSLYIIMFSVIGIMIMLRTKVNAQTIVTIQSALPNLIITLILITFSYAIVGFMIDLMYFLIYFFVYLASAANIISSPTKLITRLMTSSSWDVIFEGRNSIISAVAESVDGVLTGLGTGALEIGGRLAALSPMYLIVAIALGIATLKLLIALVKSYIMIIVQLITAPVQLLLNAMPGSQAFSGWFKRTASYIIPFPVAGVMFIFAAILVGDPTKATLLDSKDSNVFGVNPSHELYANKSQIWLPPFTLTGGTDIDNSEVLTLIGFFVFLMTPSAVKMAQEWLQVKESPYASEALGLFTGIASWPVKGGWGAFQHKRQEYLQRSMYKQIGSAIGDKIDNKG